MRASIRVWRYDPEGVLPPDCASYQVPYQEGDTVLQAQLNLYEKEEPIAFRATTAASRGEASAPWR